MWLRRRILIAFALCMVLGGVSAWWFLIRAPELPRNQAGYRYDPIEDDPAVQPFLQAAEKEAKSAEELQGSRPKGWTHGFWRVKKRILKEKYGIDWRTPAELNPDWAFD